jgi:hypothetical protein
MESPQLWLVLGTDRPVHHLGISQIVAGERLDRDTSVARRCMGLAPESEFEGGHQPSDGGWGCEIEGLVLGRAQPIATLTRYTSKPS